jgi:hypothetical protein
MAKTMKSTEPKASKAPKTTAKAAKPSASKPSPAKIGSKKDAIFRHICEQHAMGIQEVAKLDVALAVGNKNPRSDGFLKALKELTTIEGLINKGSKKDTLVLTDKGIAAMPEDLEVSNDPSKVHDRYIEFIEKKAKLGADKVRPCWEILSDRQAHSIPDIAKQLGYSNPRSFQNTKIIAAMKEMELVEPVGKGSVKFTDKVPSVQNTYCI